MVLLRGSGTHTGDRYDLDAVMSGHSDGGVPQGWLLMEYAAAVLASEEASRAELHRRIVAELGEAALVDAAAVVAIFNAVVRIADATGIPLEAAKAEASRDLRACLAIDRFADGKA